MCVCTRVHFTVNSSFHLSFLFPIWLIFLSFFFNLYFFFFFHCLYHPRFRKKRPPFWFMMSLPFLSFLKSNHSLARHYISSLLSTLIHPKEYSFAHRHCFQQFYLLTHHTHTQTSAPAHGLNWQNTARDFLSNSQVFYVQLGSGVDTALLCRSKCFFDRFAWFSFHVINPLYTRRIL